MSETIPVFISSEKRAKSLVKFVAYDSTGKLTVNANEIAYQGSNMHFTIDRKRIKSISLVRQRFDWVSFIFGSILIAGINFYYPFNFTRSTVIASTSSVIFTTFFIVFYLFFMLNYKWVLISHNTSGKEEKIYIANSSNFGWGGILGGTEALFMQLSKS